MLAVGAVSRMIVGIKDALVSRSGLRVLLFDGEVLAKREPIGCGSFLGRLHQGKLSLDWSRPLQRGTLSNRPAHLACHGFNVFVFTNSRVHPIGFQMGVEGFGMILDEIGALLIRIMCAGSQQEAADHIYDIPRSDFFLA